MNNPARALVQRRVEARWLLEAGGPARGAALEVGCGRGVGVEIALEDFGATRVDAFDLDPRMVALATERLARFGARVKLWTGDAERIAAPDAAYDAVFDFGILHHVPDWRAAVREIARVMRPGARLYCEEILARLITNPLVRRVVEHPQQGRFDADAFARALEEAGLAVRARREWLGLIAWFVAEKRALG